MKSRFCSLSILTSYFLLLTSFILLLSSCTFQFGSSSVVERGTEALSAKIVAGSNNVLYENSRSVISVDVENRGAGDVDHGIIVLNIPERFLESSKDLQDYLFVHGRGVDSPVGESRRYDFDVRVRELSDEAQQQSSTISASMCYQYSTTASPTVCLERPGDDNPSCRARSVSLGGQGGPLAVTSVDASLSPGDNDRLIPIINIDLRNKGGGLIVDPDNVLNSCLGGDSAKGGVVLLSAYLDHDGRPLTCGKAGSSGQTLINLRDGSASVVCKYVDGIPSVEGTHASQIIIKLVYGYYSVVSQKVVIKKV